MEKGEDCLRDRRSEFRSPLLRLSSARAPAQPATLDFLLRYFFGKTKK